MNRPYTEQDIIFLHAHYQSMSTVDLARHLKRTTGSIANKKLQLGLIIQPRPNVRPGDVFGRLTVIKQVEPKDGKVQFLCQCCCGKQRTIRRMVLVKQKDVSCGCAYMERTRQQNGEATLHRTEQRYRQSAKKRGLVFELTTEEFRELIFNSCMYCGAPPQPRNEYFTDGIRNNHNVYVSLEWANQQWVSINGIDRVYNNQGYTLTNCVPCCAICNWAKSAMSYLDWMAYIERLAKYRITRLGQP